MRTENIAFLIALGATLFMTIVMGAPAAIAESHADAEQEEDWASQERTLVFDSDHRRGFVFESTRDTEITHDVIQGSFDLDTVTYRVEYIHDPQPGAEGIVPDSNQTWSTMTVQFIQIIEFHDVTGDGTFSPLTDEVVRKIPLEGYRTPQMTFTTADAAKQTRVATAQFPFSSGGSFELEFHVSPTPYQVGEKTHAPTVTSFDVRLTDYPYQQDDTRVALHTQMSVADSIDYDETSSMINVQNRDPSEFDFEGRYAWDTALAGGTDTVNTTVIELPTGGSSGEASKANVLFAYPQSDTIEQSGHIGFYESPGLADRVLGMVGNWYLFIIGLLVAVVVLGGTMYLQVSREETQSREV